MKFRLLEKSGHVHFNSKNERYNKDGVKMKFRLVEDYQEYNIDDKNIFNVARVFSSDYIPDGKAVVYTVKISYPYYATYEYENKQGAINFAEMMAEKDEQSDISIIETIYNEDGSIYNEESIFDYWY